MRARTKRGGTTAVAALALTLCALGTGRADDGSAPYAHVDCLTLELDGTTVTYAAADSAEIDRIVDCLTSGKQIVEAFFGAPFPNAYAVRVYPTRAAMDRAWASEWGMPDLETQCWMVASGIGTSLSLLTPRVWKEQACEHSATDTMHVRDLITHELVHVYHGQHNPHPDFAGMDAIGWFPEGLATYVSGQLVGSHAGRDRQAIDAGAAPSDLESAWSGPYRYGVCGSLVRFIDASFGRAVIKSLLASGSEEDILSLLELSESELIERWTSQVLNEAPASRSTRSGR